MTKRKILLFTKLLISLILIIYIYIEVNSNNDILDSISKINIEFVSYVILLMIPNILIQSYRWFILLKINKSNVSYWEASGSTLGGIALGVITPGKIGEIGKSLFLKNLNKIEITGLAFLERIYNMVVILFLGLISLIGINYLSYENFSILFWLLFGIIIMLILISSIILFNPDLISLIIKKIVKSVKIKEKLNIFFQTYQKIDNKIIFKILGISIIFQLLNSFQFVLSIWAFEYSVDLLNSVFAASATTLTKAVLPFTIGDIGIRENAAIYYFSYFIENKAAIFNGSLLVFFINVIFPSICGLFMLPKMNFQKDL